MSRLLHLPLALFLCLLALHSPRAEQDYPPGVKNIVEQRCMVCHGCYDAPCQLKLDAWAGLQRGASKTKVYDGTRLVTAELTRLFEDGNTVPDWRSKGFYPVLPESDPRDNVLARMLELKRQHPLPQGELLPDSFDLGLDRDQQCPKGDEFDDYARDYPLWGMPYALPGLDEDSHNTLTQWLAEGAPGAKVAPPAGAEAEAIERWEAFFNGNSLKERLMSRYIYEHLFIGALYFADVPGSRYYQLVRSRTAPGQAIDIIATRRPYDSPGSDTFYYRLQPQRTTVVAKRHMPYALDGKRMQRWQSLFLEPDYTVDALPSYQTKIASNPFVAFQDLPLISRYKFMLDEAQFTIMGYIKGPVCRGQVALNVIDDHFWVAFVDPDEEASLHTAEFLARESDNLRMPSGKSGLLVSLVEWRSYSRSQLKFLKAKSDFLLERTTQDGANVDLDLLWDGDGNNDNAALTIFRHKDSATVVKGFVGRQPKTAWVIDYSLLERIHYLLVAGFDVYGNVGHQLETRLYMDFLRMEGEQNFLFFL
ncbi:MAG: fatty acid cis/trans isomerase, partial [Halioglobus sp.]